MNSRGSAREETIDPPPGTEGRRRLAIKDILQGAREVIIEHDGAEYRLRITARGKLILTK
jgi:hemin uptake protein HemP